jgi:hypothetical protein
MRDDLDREGAGKVMSLKFIITSDLHQNIAKWRDLVRVVKQTKLRFVLVAGDILPKDGGFNVQRKFFPVLAVCGWSRSLQAGWRSRPTGVGLRFRPRNRKFQPGNPNRLEWFGTVSSGTAVKW